MLYYEIHLTKMICFFFYTAQAISGLSDVDYPTLELGPNGLPLLRQLGLVNRVPLPPELVEHFARKSSYNVLAQ